jgi:CubicO group peptidase (beta-lactamase class C family)
MNALQRMKLLNVLTCLCLLFSLVTLMAPASATAQGNPIPVDKLAEIDAYIEAQMKELRIPGLALGIVQGDQIIHLKGFGVAVRPGER